MYIVLILIWSGRKQYHDDYDKYDDDDDDDDDDDYGNTDNDSDQNHGGAWKSYSSWQWHLQSSWCNADHGTKSLLYS